MYDRTNLTWHALSDGTLALHVHGRKGALVHVVPDAKHRGMWRVRHLDGRVSDTVNLTRAKDAGMAHGLALLNRTEAA